MSKLCVRTYPQQDMFEKTRKLGSSCKPCAQQICDCTIVVGNSAPLILELLSIFKSAGYFIAVSGSCNSSVLALSVACADRFLCLSQGVSESNFNLPPV